MADTITTWTPISAPTDFRDDAVFDIDSKTKSIQVLVGQPIVAGEHKSQFIKFQMGRYYDAIDLTAMQVNIVFLSPAGNRGISEAVNTEYSDDAIRFGWLVPYAACPEKGKLFFAVEFVGADYTFKTTAGCTQVLDSISDRDIVPEPVEQEWYIVLQANVATLMQEAQRALGKVEGIFNALGTPMTAGTAAEMVEESAIYVYTGSEPNYEYGYWYYHDGTGWVPGSEYASTALVTDSTLSKAGQAADAEAVSVALAEKADKENTPGIAAPEESDADLYICDSQGNVIAEIVDGHIRTKNFDSSDINTETDTTLTEEGKPADAKAVGDAISAVEDDIQAVEESIPDVSGFADVKTPQETTADLFICDSQGNVIAELKDGHIRTKNFDSANIDVDSPIKEASITDADLYICDSFGNVVGEYIDGHIRTKNFDSADMEGLPEDVSTLLSDVSALQSATTGILYRNQDVTDGVYASCRWHQPNSSAKQFCLLCGADVHEDKIRTASMVEYLNAIDAFDAGIILGDIGSWDKDATWYTNAISKANKPFLTVMGNHDAAGNASTDATSYEYLSDFYDKFIAPNIGYADLTTAEHPDETVYYYKDFATYGIRLIVINQYEYPPDKNGDVYVYQRGNNCYSQAQITWLCNTLMSTPVDYGVIIAMHTFPGTMRMDMSNEWVSSTWWGSSGGPADIMNHTEDGYVIMDIVDAWQNGTALSKTYRYIPTGSWTNVVVNVDFSTRGKGEFISYIGGHWHMSIMSEGYRYPDQKMYSCDCSGLYASTQGDMPRREGAHSEDSLTVLSVDRDLETVKVLKIGAHFTKDGINRLYGKYSYGGTA